MARLGPKGNRRQSFSQAFCWPPGEARGAAFVQVFKAVRAIAMAISRENQVLSSGLILASISSNDISPAIISPLMKKVGVPSTFSVSWA
jgi:hypothetical protein